MPVNAWGGPALSLVLTSAQRVATLTDLRFECNPQCVESKTYLYPSSFN
jgi:hypothetical protein